MSTNPYLCFVGAYFGYKLFCCRTSEESHIRIYLCVVPEI